MGIPEKIKRIEEEMKKTQINKATEHHVGLLKAKLAKLRNEQDERREQGTGSGSSIGYDIKKSMDATVVLIGLPNVGKSTLLNKLTKSKSKVGGYQFTTLTVVPGVMKYKGASIQILDLPGIIEGASKGKGLGKRVLSVARSADMILFLLDVSQPEVLLGNRIYCHTVTVLNKIDTVDQSFINRLKSKLDYDFIPISSDANINLLELKEAIYQKLNFIRIYMRPKGGEPDFAE